MEEAPLPVLAVTTAGFARSGLRWLLVLQSADWVVFNTHQQLELMRVTCGGWRRPFAFHCPSPTNLTFTYHQPRLGTTHVHRRSPARPRPTPTPVQGPLKDPFATQPAQSSAEHDQNLKSAPKKSFDEETDAQQACVEAQSGQGVRSDTHARCGGPDIPGVSAWGSGSRGGSGEEPVTALHAVHHGREVLCCALLPSTLLQHARRTSTSSSDARSLQSLALHSLTSDSFISESTLTSDPRLVPKRAPELADSELEDCGLRAASPLCLLTGSEDGSMRQLLHSPFSKQGSVPESLAAPADRMVRPMDGSRALDKGQAGREERQRGKAGRHAEGQQRGLFGGEEVGFQAAGSAVKSMVAMPFGAGIVQLSLYMHTAICCTHSTRPLPGCRASIMLGTTVLQKPTPRVLWLHPYCAGF